MSTPHPLRIDGHAHIFVRQLPMSPGRRYTPSQDAPLATYRTLLNAAQFSGALLVQPSFLGTDNRYLVDALRPGENREKLHFRGVCVLPSTAGRQEIAELAGSGIVGTRLNLIGVRTPDLSTAVWQHFFSRINEFGWHVEICVEGPRLAALLPPLLTYCRRVVVDHFGLPEPSAPLQCPGWKAMLSASRTQLWVKVSAPYRVFPDLPRDQAVAQCTELARVLYAHFGPHKIIWGSDWPWTRHESGITYARTVQWRTQWLPGRDDDGVADLLSLNPAHATNAKRDADSPS